MYHQETPAVMVEQSMNAYGRLGVVFGWVHFLLDALGWSLSYKAKSSGFPPAVGASV